MTVSTNPLLPTGVGLAALGLGHLVAPTAFEKILAPAFPENTRAHVRINGTIETLIGLGLAARQSRRAASLLAAAYTVYVAANVVRHR